MNKEDQARKVIGSEYCQWIEYIGLRWTNNLPYTSMEGWTNNFFSIIYEEEYTEDLSSAKMRYEYIVNSK